MLSGAFVFNKKNNKFHVWDVHPTNMTSHAAMLKRLGYDAQDCVGGSIKKNGEMHFRSNTINGTVYGKTDMKDEYSKLIKDKSHIRYDMNIHIGSYFITYI